MPTATTSAPVRVARTYASTGHVGRHMAAAQALQLEIDRLKALQERHRDWLLNHMLAKGLDRLELNTFQVVLKSRAKWSYSPSTEREALALATTQKWEQSKGIATNNPTRYIALSTVTPKA